MIARLLRWLLLVQLAAVALVAAGLVLSGVVASVWLALLAALAFALLVRLAITTNNFVLSRWLGSPTPDSHRIGVWEAICMVAREFCATMFHSSWTMPQARQRHRPHPGAHLPVLLVHGYACNSGYWQALTRALDARAIAHATIDLEPPGASIDDYAPAIAAALAALGPGPAIVVAHSMGGLAMRAYLRRYGRARVARLITLGTPHGGTALARFGIGINARQMQVGSAWLRELAASEDAATRALILSMYSFHDNIIAPQTSSVLAGADHQAFAGIGHVALGSDPAVLAAVLAEINRVGKLV
ncbi:alpha/beta fold hydrolase [Massilia sp. TS11]|uniref:alpha/beta fold hydrolase n=1 Tax=Massilia sp. TS11 TaxID=2908003 RepID=UPI001EDB52C7|nr:alpha/beta fold hydrolase [Massilia sp. TS11]MCG2584424.1 alpha/beta fold hydrolase [Massilia sp. TS11]